jgi:serine/threonine-protein kinase
VVLSSSDKSAVRAAPPAPLPRQLGRYEILDRLAVGGMAELFLAKEHHKGGLERLVVVKCILPHLAAQPAFVEMFLAEARYAAQISHPNIVQIYELGEENGAFFIAMEYVAGGSLRDVVVAARERHVDIPVAVAVSLVAQACAGAHAAHELCDDEGRPLGLVHRDISPHNLMVTSDGHVKLLDFGIAKATELAAENTRTGALKGKVHYMSPEQCRQEALDRRSDVFALGIVLWELLAQERLFKRDSELSSMQAIVEGEVPDLLKRRPDVPLGLQQALHRSLAAKKAERFESAGDMQRALVQALEETGHRSAPETARPFLVEVLGEASARRRAATRAPGERSAATPSALEEEVVDDVGDATVVGRKRRTALSSQDASATGETAPGPTARDAPVNEMEARAAANAVTATIPTRTPPGTSVAKVPAGDTLPGDVRYTTPQIERTPVALPTAASRRALPWIAAALAFVAVVVAAAFVVERPPSVRGAPIVYGFPPIVDPQLMRSDIEPLRRYLEAETGRPFTFAVAGSYQELADGLVDGHYAIASLPPYLYVQTKERAPGIELLASELFDGSRGADGVLLVLDKSRVRALADLKGKRICVTDPLSTTGFLFPRAALKRVGVDPDHDVTVHESGNHMQLLRDIVEGRCEAGGTYSGAYLTADKAGISVSMLRVLALTGRSPQNAHIAGPSTSEADRELVKAALLSLDTMRDIGVSRIGAVERISGFSEAQDGEYEEIRQALEDAPP